MSVDSVRAQLQDHLQQATELARTLPGVDGAGEETFPAWVRDWAGHLVAEWKLLVGGVAVATVAAGAFLLLLPRTYSAEALIAPTRTLTQVQFEPSIKTVDSAASQSGAGAAANATAITPERRQAYVDLVKSSDLEAAVIAQLRGIVPASDLVPGQFIDRVSGAIRPKSEIISIQAQADTPEAAVAIANTWAAAYLDRVNRIYARSGSGSATGLEGQIAQFLAQYNDAQAALTNDLQTNRVEELDRQIQEKQQSARLLQSTYQAGRFEWVTGVGGQGGAAASAPGGSSATALDTQAAREDFRLAEVQALNVLAKEVQRLRAARDSVRTLLGQAASAGLSPSDSAAIAVLKVQLASHSAALPPNLQIQLPASGSESVASLRALAESIDRSLAEASQELQAKSSDYERRRTEQLAQIEADLRDLQAQREAASATRQSLSLARDLAWKTYSAVANKLQERAVADATNGREVELASQATIGQPTSRRAPLVLGLAALLGLGVAAISVLAWGALKPTVVASMTLAKPDAQAG